jgi:ATP-binding cassette subfamily F protein 3
MFKIKNISLEFGDRIIFNNISFHISSGDKIGVIGNNGVGKSTLLKFLSGIAHPDSGKIIKNKNIRIGYLSQELSSHKNITLKRFVINENERMKVLKTQIQEVTEYLENHLVNIDDKNKNLEKLILLQDELYSINNQNKEYNSEKIMKGLGFTKTDFKKYINDFSGGWRTRAELCKLLFSEPDVILLDEPTNHLDLPSIIWLEKFLLKFSKTIVMVSHDTTFIDKLTNRTIEISRGKIKDFSGSYFKFRDFRKKELNRQLKEEKKQNIFRKKSKKLIEKFKYKKNKASFAQQLIKRIEKIPKMEVDSNKVSNFSFIFPPPKHSGKVIFQCDKLSKKFNDKIIFKNVNLNIYNGDKIAFVGKNGNGKTTLTKIINQDEDISTGVYKIGEKVHINYFAQNHIDHFNLSETIFEYIEKKSNVKNISKLRAILGSFLFSKDDIYKKIGVLSGGEKSRLAICGLLLQEGNVLILDEPTNHLDIYAKNILKNALRKYEGTLIIVSHDRDFLSGLTDRVIEFKDNTVREFPGDIDNYLSQEDLFASNIVKEKKEIKKSNGKRQYEEKKNQNKVFRQLKKKIIIVENKIEELENQLFNLNVKLEKNNIKELNFDDFDHLNELIKLEMDKWEGLHEKLELLKYKCNDIT